MTHIRSIDELKILFVGARDVGHLCLEALLKAGINVVGLLTLHTDRASKTVSFRSFDDLARAHELNVRSFQNLKNPDHAAWAEELRPDLGIVVGVSQLVPPALLNVPAKGFLGMHPTFLPVGRGRAPIPWTIIKQLEWTGVSIFECVEQADAGRIVLQKKVPVYYEDTAATLGSRTDEVTAELLVESVSRISDGTARPWAQDLDSGSVWPRRHPEDGAIDWNWSGRRIYDWVRALTHPYPGAFTLARDKKLMIWSARESQDERRGKPGEILSVTPSGLLVACRDGCVLVQQVQWPDEGKGEVHGRKCGLTAGERLF